MINKNEIIKDIDVCNFKRNNGLVLTTLNILRNRYTKITDVLSVFITRGIVKSDLLDSVNFLSEEGYIGTRDIKTKEDVIFDIANWENIEIKLTGKGIRILMGGIFDNMIEV